MKHLPIFFSKKIRLRTILTLTIISIVYVLVGGLFYGYLESNKPSPSPSPSVQSSNTTVGIPNTPSPNTSRNNKVATKTETDPVANCEFDKLGKSYKIPLSQCKISFECEINHQWYIFTSRDQCTQKQNEWKASLKSKTTFYYPPPIPNSWLTEPSFWDRYSPPPLNLPEVKTQPIEPFKTNLGGEYRCYKSLQEYWQFHPEKKPQSGASITYFQFSPQCEFIPN